MNSPIIKTVRNLTLCMLFVLSFSAYSSTKNTVVIIDTNKGPIEIELYDARAPKTVSNFLSYVNEGFYNGTVFHRVIPNFMIQGGGFTKELSRKSTKAPIKNEANAFIPNIRGTIAMARTNDPHSATSQFFINVVDNTNLNKSSYSAGYAVFGKVISGMNVADSIAKARTKSHGPMQNVPVESIVINEISIKQQNIEK